MRILNIQSLAFKSFKYKNKPINFGTKYNFNTQKGDIVEIYQKLGFNTDTTAASKRYYYENRELSPDIIQQNGHRVFIKRKNGYMPYSANIDEYSAKGELIRSTLYNNGYKFIVLSYDKNKDIVQEDMYQDTCKGCYYPNKRTSVRKFDGMDEYGMMYKVPLRISRNYGKDWQTNPKIELEKTDSDNSLRVIFDVPSKENKIGMVKTVRQNGQTRTTNTIYPSYDGTKDGFIEDYEDMLQGLIELRETILSDEYKDDFGFSKKLNAFLDKYIEAISSKVNED